MLPSESIRETYSLRHICTSHFREWHVHEETLLRLLYDISTALQRYYTENSKHIFPEKELRGHNPIATFMFHCAIYIFSRAVCIFCCKKIAGPIVAIYKSLTDV
jgi:hypothetical protein